MTELSVRVGDAERREVDDRLMAAVGDGVLTLVEYDERSAKVWQSRTRGELAAVTADLPPARPSERTAVRERRSGLRSRLSRTAGRVGVPGVAALAWSPSSPPARTAAPSSAATRSS